MVSINYSAREVCCKIVYYGPGLSGKTTNLQYVHSKVPATTRGKLISLATEADRTLYFDFLPINIGTINGFQAKFQLYTVPGQVYYNATRKLVLRGVDGIVFVADSQPDKMDENLESLANLEENLSEYGYDINEIPLAIQYNKRDLPGVLSLDELQAKLNTRGWAHFESSATIGNGVFDTLKLIIRLVLDKTKSRSSEQAESTPAESAAPGVESTQPVSREAIVDATASATKSEPATTTPVQAKVDSQPSEPVREAAYRPYPGTEEADVQREKPAGDHPPTIESSAPQDEATEGIEAVPDPGTSGSIKHEAALTAPQMAPSIRSRGDRKKRGFFKRLFGIR